MDDTGRDEASSLSDQERATDTPLPLPRTPIDAGASGALSEPFPTHHSVVAAPGETLLLDLSSSSATGLSVAAARPLVLQGTPTLKMSQTSPAHNNARKRRQSSGNGPPEVRQTSLERPLLSNSQWEREIAGFGSVLNDVLHCVTNRELVAKTAEYMASFPQHARRFQIKMKQRAHAEKARGFQAKLMLFYVLHEFLKSFDGERLEQVQREWFQTVDEVLNACAREIRSGDKRSMEENRKRVFKTLARWEELELYPRKIKAWKSVVMGECKPRRAPMSLPRSESERQAEAPDQLQSFELAPPSTPQLQLDRSNCPLVFERHNFGSKLEEKQHWRYTAIAFIDILSRCLGLSSDISLTACTFFHRVFDRGIYARERYKFAAACLFLSAKASSKRMKLLRMVRVMYDILETPLFAGDEELLEIERLQLLYYEMEVLQGIDFELTMDLPFYYLRRVLDKMPEKFRLHVNDDAQAVLEELFFLPACVDMSPRLIGESAAYIATWAKGKDFKFKWCSSSQEDQLFNERRAKDVLRYYRSLQKWKDIQQTEFDALVKSSASLEGDKAVNLKNAFEHQLGGLRLDPSLILNEAEFTKKTEEDSKAWTKSGKKNGSSAWSSKQRASGRYKRSERYTKSYKDGNEPRIKEEPLALASEQEGKDRHGHSNVRNSSRYQPPSRSRSQSRSGSGSRYRSGYTVKHARENSRAHSGEYRDRDRYDYDDYDDYDDRDRHRERRRGEDKYDSRDRSFCVDRDSRDHDRYSSRDLDYRRDPSYFDRRDRKKDRRGYHESDSRSTSRSSSQSRSPRDFSRSSSKRQRKYTRCGHSESRSRSSSRSYSRDRSEYYRTEDTLSSMSFRSGRASKYGTVRSSHRKTERPRIKQERSVV